MEKDKNEIKKEDDYYNVLKNYMKHYKSQNKLNAGEIIKIISIIVFSLVFLGVFVLIGIMTFKNGVGIETIISLVIALFSIFMSVFFYFKADESNTKFYNSSYSFMKDVSVILGRMEERFGEKLTNMTEKLNDIKLAEKQLDNVEDDKEKMIDELIEKANLNEAEKEKYKKELDEKEKEAKTLREELSLASFKYVNKIELPKDFNYMYNLESINNGDILR